MWGVIKRDLADFVTQVRDEAAEAVKSIVDLSAEEAEQGENPAPPVAAMVRAFRLDENTYRDAIGVAEQADFDTFCGGLEWIVEGDQKDEEIVKNPELLQLLEEDSGMQTIHEQLVPALMTDRVFWSRYLFRYNRLINQKERAGLLALALERNDDDEDLGGWDDDQDLVEDRGVSPGLQEPAMSLESRLTAVERERDELKAQVDSLTESLRQARLAIAEAEQAQKLSRASSPAVMVSEPSDHDDQEWGCGEDEDEESWK